jgi:hypothetical protein
LWLLKQLLSLKKCLCSNLEIFSLPMSYLNTARIPNNVVVYSKPPAALDSRLENLLEKIKCIALNPTMDRFKLLSLLWVTNTGTLSTLLILLLPLSALMKVLSMAKNKIMQGNCCRSSSAYSTSSKASTYLSFKILMNTRMYPKGMKSLAKMRKFL